MCVVAQHACAPYTADETIKLMPREKSFCRYHTNYRDKLGLHGVILVFAALYQLSLLVRPEHGRTIPLPDVTRICGQIAKL
jgi:hypothetical protein